MNIYTKLLFPFLLAAFCCGGEAYAQNADSLPIKKESGNAKKHVAAKQQAQDEQQPMVIRPIVGLGAGMMSYIGNVKAYGNSTIQNPMSGQLGYDLTLTQKLSPRSEFSLYFLYGNLSVTQRTVDANWNFLSNITGGGLHFLYKFLPKQEVTPYAVIGVETFEYYSRADIYDQSGNEYYYWTDGSIRSQPQSSPGAASAKILQQDYQYSTDIRSLDLDGSGKYSQQTFAIPFGVGFMFHIGTKADFMIGSTLHYTFTDHIDGLTPQVPGSLKGNTTHDMFLMSSIGIRISLNREHPKTQRFKDVTFDPDLIKDTVKPYVASNTTISDSDLQKQYDMYMDSTGKYGKVVEDPFQWKTANPVVSTNAASPMKSVATASNKTSEPAPVKTSQPAPAKTAPAEAPTTIAVAPKTSATTDMTNIVYKVQLLATYTKLAEGITFAGINDTASIDIEDGMFRYSSGHFTNLADAQNYLNKLKGLGYVDAFIKGSKNGENITVSPENGGAVQASPQVVVAAETSPQQTDTSGLVFKVQLGVFAANPDENFKSMLNQFKDVTIVKDNAGLYHYLEGYFKDLKSANASKDQAFQAGVKQACILSFFNGHPISNEQALKMIKKQ